MTLEQLGELINPNWPIGAATVMRWGRRLGIWKRYRGRVDQSGFIALAVFAWLRRGTTVSVKDADRCAKRTLKRLKSGDTAFYVVVAGNANSVSFEDWRNCCAPTRVSCEVVTTPGPGTIVFSVARLERETRSLFR